MKALLLLIIIQIYRLYRLFYKYIESIIIRTNAQKKLYVGHYRKRIKICLICKSVKND